MTDYNPPLKEMSFLINEVLNLGDIAQLPSFEDVSPDLVAAILNEAGRFFAEVVAPSNRIADTQGTRVENGRVLTAPAMEGLYQAYMQAGWPSLIGDPQFGGQGLPHLLGITVEEMLQSANLSFSLLPMLTMGVTTALTQFGSDEQKAYYLPRLISGEWAGAMNLTESQAGSDLAAVKTRALPRDDHYLITGQKIFISWGDHDFTDNIIHLVLARTPDAPAGVKGISLFIVPKNLCDAQGTIEKRNDVYPVSVEHKLGIHGSPTCVVNYGENGGAVGYLVGQENEGLSYMFAMMNHARLSVGLQGVAIGELAYQKARCFAMERVQGNGSGAGRTIIQHPDVRRMLLLMKSQTEAGRILTYAALSHWDLSTHSVDREVRKFHQRRVEILTPIVKGWCTETANEVTSLGVQVHGGMGYIEETGAAQYLRDARIMAIYEGTNGIQALDLMGRKLLRDQGAAVQELFSDMDEIIEQCREAGLDDIAQSSAAALACSKDAVEFIFRNADTDHNFSGAVAFDFMQLMGITVGGCLLAKSAILADGHLRKNTDNQDFWLAKMNTVRFFMQQIMPRTETHLRVIQSGQTEIMALGDEDF